MTDGLRLTGFDSQEHFDRWKQWRNDPLPDANDDLPDDWESNLCKQVMKLGRADDGSSMKTTNNNLPPEAKQLLLECHDALSAILHHTPSLYIQVTWQRMNINSTLTKIENMIPDAGMEDDLI